MRTTFRPHPLPFFFVAAAAVACARTEEPRSEPAPPPKMVIVPPPAPVPDVTWIDPPAWRRLSQGSEMRRATYKIAPVGDDSEEAEVAVFYFGQSQGGSTTANIDRWVSQFPDTPPGDVKRSERQVNGMKQTLVDIEGTFDPSGMTITDRPRKPNFRMIGAVVETPAGSYFFKLSGPAKTVESAKRPYMALLDTVRSGADAPAASSAARAATSAGGPKTSSGARRKASDGEADIHR